VEVLRATGVRPVIDSELPLASIAEGFAAMERGDVLGKIVAQA